MQEEMLTDSGIHPPSVHKTHENGYVQSASYRYYYAAYELNRELAESLEVVL